MGDEAQQQQQPRLATLERVSSYSLVNKWWTVASEYYSNAKNSDSQTLATSVVFAERLAAPALRGLSRIPEYCPEGMVEVVDGVAVRQLESAEQIVESSTSYALSTKDAAVSRGTEMVSNSATYLLSTRDAVQEAATSSYEGSRKVLESTVSPFSSRVDQWRKTLQESFLFGGKKAGSGEEKEGGRAPSLTKSYDHLVAVFPGIVHYDGDRILIPLKNCYDGCRKRYEFTRWMAHQAKETGKQKIQEAQDLVRPAIANPTQTAVSLRDSSRSFAVFLLTTQRSFLETLREGIVSIEKNRGGEEDSLLVRQLERVPSFVFVWSTKTIDFSDGVLAWTNDYVAPSPVVVEE